MTARLKQGMFRTTDLDQHVELIKGQFTKSMNDAETRQLAVQIVSGSYDYIRDRVTGKEIPVVHAWGRTFRAPPGAICKPRDYHCEIERIWDFVVLNMRYVYDPANIDTFCTTKVTLTAGGADCDDAMIVFASLLGAIGFHVIGRVISTQEAPGKWVHIYPLVGTSKDDPQDWLPLDMTVDGAKPGWEFGSIAKTRDYLFI